MSVSPIKNLTVSSSRLLQTLSNKKTKLAKVAGYPEKRRKNSFNKKKQRVAPTSDCIIT